MTGGGGGSGGGGSGGGGSGGGTGGCPGVLILVYSVDCEFLVFRGGILSECLMLGGGGYFHINHQVRNFSWRTYGATAGESRCGQATE